jgi:hypothetical protein
MLKSCCPEFSHTHNFLGKVILYIEGAHMFHLYFLVEYNKVSAPIMDIFLEFNKCI